MHRSLLFSTLLLLSYSEVFSFCGFYVAKADASLFNESSQVIMVRDGNHTVITMSNDFKGDVQDFAMVIPVPEVLQRNDIRVVRQQLFSKFDAFTAPRMVEYYDPEPNCPQSYVTTDGVVITAEAVTMDVQYSRMTTTMSMNSKLQVKVKARYKVDEYDIVILSAKQSDGLEKWLKWNGYKMPEGAREALDPYVKSGMNFFVVKVDLARQQKSGFTKLRPLQIQFNSPKFMLPIRLGMANAKAAQDMIVYAFTKSGRVETTNYRTLKVPTDRDIPHSIKNSGKFGPFYKAVFDKTWEEEGQNGVFLEYSWDQTGQNPVKCDPCNSPLITLAEMEEAGVWWLKPGNANSQGGYTGDLHVTRLHIRYAREKFPQDLAFMVTPNKEKFQARYVVRHPARGPFNCEIAATYLKDLKKRYQNEVTELAALTGWNTADYQSYVASVPRLEPKEDWSENQNEQAVPKLKWEPVEEPEEVETPEKATTDETSPPSPAKEDQGAAFVPKGNTNTEGEFPTPLLASLPEQPFPLPGILLSLSGLILGLALFVRQRKSTAEKHSR